MSNHIDPSLEVLHVTADGFAAAVAVPAAGPLVLRQMVGGPIEGVTVCGELSFCASLTAAQHRA